MNRDGSKEVSAWTVARGVILSRIVVAVLKYVLVIGALLGLLLLGGRR